MAIRSYYDVWCDHRDCSEWDPRCTSSSRTKCAEAARACGWEFKRHQAFCPMHREKDPITPEEWYDIVRTA